ncbi:MAG: HEPN domain-containing protein [Nanoarchaeota archaeon]|nr:HEPN domain-containing protein [Nanoarchaeota archaeon]
MKKTNFLNKLIKEGKLELVEPSEEVKKAYIKKSESNMGSAKILLNSNKLEESISLVYYSMYHLLTALLFKIGIKSENHLASIVLLKRLFNQNNNEILTAKRERIDKQYYINFSITKEEVKDAIKKADIFNSEISDFISKLTNERIQEYRKTFKEIIN